MVVEEGGRTVRSFIETMKEQPLGLAMVCINLVFLGYLYYSAVIATNERHVEMQMLYDNRKYVTDILASCVHIKDLEPLLRERKQGYGTIWNERHARGADADSERTPGNP